LILLQAAPAAGALEFVPLGRGVSATGPVLDLAFIDDERLLALTEDALVLYRLDDSTPSQKARLELPGARLPVRAPAGVLRVSEAESACWLVTNSRPTASLVAVEGQRLAPRLEADALPWLRSAVGLRYRAGTNQLVFGESLFLGMREDGLAVAEDGRLAVFGRPEAQGRRVGAALARLGGLVVASSARPPGAADSLELIRLDGDLTELAAEAKVEGSIAALAARNRSRGSLVVAAIQGSDGVTRLLSYAVRARP
jgi:hypothetical protein